MANDSKSSKAQQGFESRAKEAPITPTSADQQKNPEEKQFADQQPKSLDLFISTVLHISDFLRKSCAYQQSNPDEITALSQLDVYGFLVDLCLQLITNAKSEDLSENAWLLLEEVLKVVDQGSTMGLQLSSSLGQMFKGYCQFKGIPSHPDDSGSLSSPPRKRCRSVDDYHPVKYQSMATSEGEDAESEDAESGDSEGEDVEGLDSSEGEDAEGEDSKGKDSEDQDSKSEDSEGENSEGEKSEGQNSEGENSEGGNSEGENSKAEDSEGEDSEGENSEGENSEGENSESENSEDEESESNDDSGESSDSESSPNLAEKMEIQITDEDQKRVLQLVQGSQNQVVVNKFKLRISRGDLRTLYGRNWLNDNVINFYMELLNQRAEQHVGQLPSVYAMSTFFLPRLLASGYAAVSRWTRKIDIFSKEIIPVPVHRNGTPKHWTMVIIHMRDKAIRYYDSMGESSPSVLQALNRYLQLESLDKRKQPFDTSGFKLENVRKVPRQLNTDDCGVFCCAFAEYITRDAPITFGQKDMASLRKKMILEIADGQLWS